MTQRLGAFLCCVLAAAAGCVVLTPVAEAGWLPPVDISEPSELARSPHVVLDSGGNATAVWDRWNGVDTVVESAYRPAGKPWGPPVDLSEPPLEGEVTPGAHDAQSPQIAVDGQGDVTVIWERYAGDKILLQSVERPVEGDWTAPVTIGEANLGPDPEPWIAVDVSGDAVAVWKRSEVIQSAFRPGGGEWEAPSPISAGESFVPQVAMNAAGDATAVWMHFDGSDNVVESAYRPGGGEWEAPTLVSQPGEWAGNPHVALDAVGNTLVAWRGGSGGEEYVRAAYRPVGDSWEPPTNASAKGEQVQGIRDAVDPDGNAIVAWAGNDGEVGGHDIVRAAFRPNGGTWEAPSSLSADGGNGFPSNVVFDTGGNAAIVWQRYDGSSNVVQAAYRPAGGDWEPTVDLSEEGKQGMNAVVVLDAPGDATVADGNATAVWVSREDHACESEEVDCPTYTVQAAGYDPDGLPSVDLELPATAEVGEPVAISVPNEGLFSPLIEFGDGESAADTEASHSYEEPGEYQVSAIGAEVLGYTASTQRTITIVPAGENPESEQPTPTEPSAQGPTESAGQSRNVAVETAPSDAGASAACVAARATLHSARSRLKHLAARQRSAGGDTAARHFAAAKRQQLAVLNKALQRIANTC
jgi:hypothetical protein